MGKLDLLFYKKKKKEQEESPSVAYEKKVGNDCREKEPEEYSDFENRARGEIAVMFKKSPRDREKELHERIMPLLDVMETEGAIQEGEVSTLFEIALDHVESDDIEQF